MLDKILIDRETLKVIAADTRMDILKLLFKKKYTLSEISKKLKLGNSTVSEHLTLLSKAELIKKEETNRKWKYYTLTKKGICLVNPDAQKTFFSFIFNLTITVVVGIYIFIQLFLTSILRTTANKNVDLVFDSQTGVMSESMPMVSETVLQTSNNIQPTFFSSFLNFIYNNHMIIIFCLLLLMTLFLYIRYRKLRK